MKKTFELTHPKIKPARMVDSIKYDVKKYIKRERNKALPEDFDFWDFDCKFGEQEETAEVVHLTAINKSIDSAVEQGLTNFYIEIIARAAERRFSVDVDVDSEE